MVNNSSVIILFSRAKRSKTSLAELISIFLLLGKMLKLGDKYFFDPAIFSSTK